MQKILLLLLLTSVSISAHADAIKAPSDRKSMAALKAGLASITLWNIGFGLKEVSKKFYPSDLPFLAINLGATLILGYSALTDVTSSKKSASESRNTNNSAHTIRNKSWAITKGIAGIAALGSGLGVAIQVIEKPHFLAKYLPKLCEHTSCLIRQGLLAPTFLTAGILLLNSGINDFKPAKDPYEQTV